MRKKKYGMVKDKALLRTLATKKSQPYALRRLMKDLQEIEKNEIPTVGVTARPQNDNMYIWHANLRGPEGTPYEGGVFHLVMTFPTNYPHSPPTVVLSTPIPHPCVSGNTVNLDMLDVTRKGVYEGWTSGYSVLSILVQLQSFLFEAPVDFKEKSSEIRKAVKQANEFVLPDIGHRGPLSPWPPFVSKEKETDPSSYKLKKTEKELRMEELLCFHTKLPISETYLGVGVSIARLPRTGEIRSVEPTLDLLSLKAYMKEGLRHSLDNVAFTHWLPLYFGMKPEVVLLLANKALGMICKGSTRKFEPKFIVDVFPKLMVTLVVNMMEQKEHTSLKALRALIYFFRLFVMMLDQHPELYSNIDEMLGKFKDDEKNRVKDVTPNLGNLLSFLTVSKKYKWSDLMLPYLEEQMDRQVFWIVKDIPEMETMKDDSEIDDERINVSFQATMVGFHLTLFYSVFISKFIQKEGRNRDQLLKGIDEMYGILPEAEETALQKLCDEIRNVKDYYGYFKMLGIPFPSKKELFQSLQKSIGNSKRKQYHGSEDKMNELPPTDKMIAAFQQVQPPSLDTLKEKDELLPADNPKWKEYTLAKFAWISDNYSTLPEKERPKPCDLAEMSDNLRVNEKEDEKYIKKNKEILGGDLNKMRDMTSYKDYPDTMNWRDLFIKLDFEYFMELFAYNPDFKKFYAMLELIRPHVKCLSIMIIPKKLIKSGYHWITALLCKLDKLETLKLYTKGIGGISLDVMKCFFKGITNFHGKGGKLKKLEFNRMSILTDNKLLACLRCTPNLEVLKFNGLYVTQPIASAINKIITDFKFVRELDLRNCKLTVTCGKEIADGLMRAKQMEILNLADNPSLSDAISSILYNMAFSPKISFIDISRIRLNGRAAENVESVCKLLGISGSLKSLIMDETHINNQFREPFFKALGMNKTLVALSMNGNPFNNYDLLGKAIGLNARKQGSLEYFSAVSSFSNYNSLKTFIENLWVSEYDNELWYGDVSEANKMHGEQKEKYFHCQLKEFILGKTNLISNITLNTVKYLKYDKYPAFLKFVCENPTLKSLCMPSSYLNKNDGEALGLCLKSEGHFSNLRTLDISKNALRKEGARALATVLSTEGIKLENLDISGNKIGVSGAKAFAEMLKVNKSLKVLNLFSNIIDVDGARALRDSLKVNCTLESLDVGLNRLREKGVMALAEGLYENKNTAVKSLGLRFNFIADDGIQIFFDKEVFSGKCKLDYLYLKGNYITEPQAALLQKTLEEKKIVMHVDIFEKMKYMVQDKLDRSIWISPIWSNDADTGNKIKTFFEDNVKVGVVVDVRVRTGGKVAGKPKSNIYAVVEFAHVNSVPRALRVASKKQAVINGNRIRIYKAGTRTQAIIKPPKVKRGRQAYDLIHFAYP
eukprot:TRINITY_DN25959_c0_g1_i1.p1 TRINITY_DN25959_c0_g1~~TRINITY_DN25959_c0_g1_i1.p1  ORF type:complete len:1431 (-),score=259.64 TRINITY_DN25959_c0_g1_i1:38-4204(-)